MSRFIRSNNKNIIIFFVICTLLFGVLNISTIADEDPLPDLIPDSLIAPSPWEQGEEAEIIFKIQNVGNKNISEETIEVGLFIDAEGSPVASNSTNKTLEINEMCFINISWIPTIVDGQEHTLHLIINYNDLIEESNHFNNIWSFPVEFPERSTDLEIIDIDAPDDLAVNETANILATIRNNGQNTNNAIYAGLNSSEDGEIEVVLKEDGLAKDDIYVFSFNWTPSHFGSQTLCVNVSLGDTSHDIEELSVNVGVGPLEWWNENWHYMYFLTVNGSGNVSHFFNFTELLNDLNVCSETFENNTIRIIRYSNDGLVDEEINKYWFNESSNFSSENNATGTFYWNVSNSSNETYYCIYFDVANNSGIRALSSEDETIDTTGDNSVTPGFVDGWKAEIIEPIDNGYTLISNPINISVFTDAIVENVTAFIFLTDDESQNFSLNLTDVENKVKWEATNVSFTDEGNWTIRVLCKDKVNYTYVIEQGFFVGKPDLELVNLSLSTDWSTNPTIIYKNSSINITANIFAYNATVENVNISISIVNKSNDQEVPLDQNYVFGTIVKDKITSISIEWYANISGDFDITVTVDPLDMIDESNEDNNNASIEVTIHEWPDLFVKDIILPSKTVMEYDEVKIDIVIENKGLGNASGYIVKLFIEEAPSDGQKIMTYTEEKDSKTVSVVANSSETISLYWDSASSGIWLVGVKILVKDGQRDTNIINNHMLSDDSLIIRSYERTSPTISHINVEPDEQEQGGTVTITADVTDDTGLASVTITITDPEKTIVVEKENMIRTTGDEFKYTFEDTLDVGEYVFEIEAIDISIHKNTDSVAHYFTIIADETDPVISYFDADPYVRLKDESVTISCIATDNILVKTVTVTIVFPDDTEQIETMDLSSDGKYEYTAVYESTGKYTYQILVIDGAGNWVKSDEDIFWITTNINDTDNDGMPNDWEERYNLDPEDPTDANEDSDRDGFTNLEEYKLGSHPEKDILLQNIANRVKENVWYLVGSIIAFLMILILSMYGKRRKNS